MTSTIPPRRLLLGAAAVGALGRCGGGASDGVGADGKVTVELWHGQNDTGRKAVEALVAEFNRTHPRIRVDSAGGGVLADAMLQKVTAALAAGSYPDIAYVFGSDLAGVARSPRVVDLTSALRGGPTPWSDFWAPVREAVTVNGKVWAAPALLDSLAVVYNKRLFRRAGVPFPEAGWTWDEFVAKIDYGASGTCATTSYAPMASSSRPIYVRSWATDGTYTTGPCYPLALTIWNR
jgi:multiple sugar transport system substrate-binding protein